MQNEIFLDGIGKVCEAVMYGVAKMLKPTSRKIDYAKVCQIMKEEVGKFFSKEDHSYDSERICCLKGSLHEGIIISAVVARCVERALAEGGVQ